MNLRQLSQILALSPTTVSRALNGYPEVNKATRARVLAAALHHNYQPSSRAIQLATGRAMAVGHVIPITDQHEMMNPVFSDFIAGAGEVYSQHGYDMVLSAVPDHEQERSYRQMKSRGSVDGIIVHGPRLKDPRIALLTDIGLPFVVHGRVTGSDRPYSWIDVNSRRAFHRATGFLLDLGHRKIALINGPERMDSAIRRRNGYIEALAAHGIYPDPALMISCEMTETNGYRACRPLLAQSDPPTALLVSSMITAIGARRAIEERGLQLGRDLSIIIHDDALSYLPNGDEVPIFTATRSSVREAGCQSADMLLDLIAHPDQAPKNRLLEADLIIGQSTGPAPHLR